MIDIVYEQDKRYPGPDVASPKAGEILTQEQLDAMNPLYSWADVKEFARAGRLDKLGRTGKVQYTYEQWKAHVKQEHGTLEKYLRINNLPWGEEPDDADAAVQKQHSVDGVDAYLRWDKMKDGKNKTWAVLRNQMPYAVPRDVRHFVVWVRVPIYSPKLVHDDKDKWEKIQNEGLGGFTGIIPPADDCSNLILPSGPPPISQDFFASLSPSTGDWHHHDQLRGGTDIQKWYGVRYEAEGGHEVGSMVRALWDERGWECVWVANPARIQSIPGLAHFHVFARRKAPDEIDASEAVWGTD
ncbi:hypothetical protein L198_08283 [Cryptococcus wingfieldii CBS 7118]|uniref:Uncharacterized protein n=1 Tax=Cryptococcus wingfieldii CBS 7118 TaxID=1295528 RepID=A0A1E3HBC1_9TREE|nr:hypothetical protein L198_08283 [Cryptococcus wingfieldii CBS 7118]ODN73632.1 hypothetical protein L198_08283 [Cryptococcus wingfieldii CBS 7118]